MPNLLSTQLCKKCAAKVRKHNAEYQANWRRKNPDYQKKWKAKTAEEKYYDNLDEKVERKKKSGESK